ncbi:hypothetical protein [Aquiflexum lacus]|uniref:hypothetical protein n=1 Tax=Aquiflexum lacus TaxID=2483805 RepID=UPI00189364D9|nr:hypothetical protein [Aquiflexum lacus]
MRRETRACSKDRGVKKQEPRAKSQETRNKSQETKPVPSIGEPRAKKQSLSRVSGSQEGIRVKACFEVFRGRKVGYKIEDFVWLKPGNIRLFFPPAKADGN